MSQPIYDTQAALSFLNMAREELGPLPPLLIGILPLVNERHANFIHNEVPGISIPEAIRDRIEASGEGAVAEGIKIAIELIEQFRPSVQGVYLMPPFNRFDYAAEIIEQISQPVA
jgi:homocysteine S-methyltransferase